MHLTGRFVLLLAAGLIPLIALGHPLVLVVWLLLCAGLVAVDLALAAGIRHVSLERLGPQRVRRDEQAAFRLAVTNHAPRMLVAEVRDAWGPTAGADPQRMRVRVPAGERRILDYTLTPRRRGERRVRFVALRSRGPLGLAARQFSVELPGSIRVLPPFTSRRHLPSRLARLRELDGQTSLMIRGQGTEFDSLREYVDGDDVRSIDWRATARSRETVVRTWRPERDRRVIIVIDSGRLSAARIGDEARLDTSFEAALLLAALAGHAGDRVETICFDRRIRARVSGAGAGDGLGSMVDALAPVESELLETDWAAVPEQVRRLTTQRSLVVLLTTADSAGSARGMLDVLPALTSRHLVVVASVVDPAVRGAAADRSSSAAVYRAAAAERALLDADRVAGAVRRLGGISVAALGAELPPRLADEYLALKAAGRL